MLTRVQIGNNVYAVYDLTDMDVSVDHVSIMMINNNQNHEIGLAPITFEGINGSYSKMMFDVTGKVTLREYISKSISQQDFKVMLTNLINTLENFDEIMIDSKQVMLDLDSVFINVLDHKIAFLCIALEGFEQNGNLYSFFKEIVSNSYVTAGFNEASYFNLVYNVMHTENGFSLQNLRTAMNDSAADSSSVQPSAPQRMDPMRPTPSYEEPQKVEEPPTITVSPAKEPDLQPIPSVQQPETDTKKKGLLGGLFSQSKKKKAEPAPTGYQGGLANIMNNAKSEKAGVPAQQAAAPAQQPTAPAQQPTVPPVQTQPVHTQESGQLDFGGTTVLSGGMANTMRAPVQENPAPQPAPQIQPADTVGTTVLNQTEPVSSAGSVGTTVLQKPEPAPQNSYVGTTVLNAGMQSSPGTTVLNPQQAVKRGSIIRLRTNERFFITKSTFFIGRDMAGIDCDVHDNTNVGHRHASIVQRGNDFFVVDQNSTNHTYLNGNMILGGVETKLSDGDRLRFADEEFDFRFV